jgi:hypothetical protein
LFAKALLVTFFFFCGAATHRGLWPLYSWGFLDHTQRRTTVSRTPLDEWSARRRDFYLTTHNTRNRQISMPRVWFEPTISPGERPQTYVLDRAATGTGVVSNIVFKNMQYILTGNEVKAHQCAEDKSVNRVMRNWLILRCRSKNVIIFRLFVLRPCSLSFLLNRVSELLLFFLPSKV